MSRRGADSAGSWGVAAAMTLGVCAAAAGLALPWSPTAETEAERGIQTRSPELPPAALQSSQAAQERRQALLGSQQAAPWGRDFYFTRGIYSGGGRRRGRSWATDFPKADRQFLFILDRLLTQLDLYDRENPVALDDPELRRYPFLYMLEVGYMDLTETEVVGLRSYLEAGGFLVIDDFWGEREWANFEYQLSRVLPDRQIRKIPMDHAIFHQFYDIEEVLQVPNVGNGVRGGPYGECWGPCDPGVFGIFDDRDELMVVINFNTDLGDAWEWSENPYYPIDRSNYAYEMAINLIIYAMSH